MMSSVLSLEAVRAIALSLPEVAESDHHGMGSYRVRGKIFATVPDDEHVRVMADEPEILAAVAAHPDACEPYYWGKRLACVVVTLAAVEGRVLRELLLDAWNRKAPASISREFDADSWLV